MPIYIYIFLFLQILLSHHYEVVGVLQVRFVLHVFRVFTFWFRETFERRINKHSVRASLRGRGVYSVYHVYGAKILFHLYYT